MASFKETFGEPLRLSNGTTALDGSISKEDAAVIFSEYFGERVGEREIDKDLVRFGFPSIDVEDYEGLVRPCWYSGVSEGRGAKQVWIAESR